MHVQGIGHTLTINHGLPTKCHVKLDRALTESGKG